MSNGLTLENLEKVWAARDPNSLDELEAISEWLKHADLILMASLTWLLALTAKASPMGFLIGHSAICLKLGYEMARLEELERIGTLKENIN